MLELAGAIGRALDIEPTLEHLPPRNEVVHAFSDHARVRATFDPPAPLDLETGIQRMADWVRAHGTRDPVEFTGRIEIDRELPPSWIRRPSGG